MCVEGKGKGAGEKVVCVCVCVRACMHASKREKKRVCVCEKVSK